MLIEQAVEHSSYSYSQKCSSVCVPEMTNCSYENKYNYRNKKYFYRIKITGVKRDKYVFIDLTFNCNEKIEIVTYIIRL